MKQLSPGFQAHLDSGATTLAWCWKITRADGVVFGFTDHDRTLTFDGVDFESDSGFAASEIRAATGLAVDAQDAEGALRSDRITETDILDGRWDNARIEVWRVNWENVAQRALLRRGNIGAITRGAVSFTAEVRSLAHVLNQPVGRSFQYYCDAELGDARCGVDLDAPAFSATAVVSALEGDRGFTVANALSDVAADWFAKGLIDWSSGANVGRRAEIAAHARAGTFATIHLVERPIRAIAPGDAFTIRAGCDKRFASCRAKFANAINFRGFPSIPGDELVVRYPNQGDGITGRPLVQINDE